MWCRHSAGTREVDEPMERSRAGGEAAGLRVYLDRAWNASGYGEMLGVVLPPAAFAGDPDTSPAGRPYKDYVTQWGNDPIWDSAFVPASRRAAHFPLARTAPDPAGAWLPPNAPATESRSAPGAFRVERARAADAPARVRRSRSRRTTCSTMPTRQLWYLRHRDRGRRVVLSVHPAGAGALSADLDRRRAPVERGAGRRHGADAPIAG